jgi:hypothetical protein
MRAPQSAPQLVLGAVRLLAPREHGTRPVAMRTARSALRIERLDLRGLQLRGEWPHLRELQLRAVRVARRELVVPEPPGFVALPLDEAMQSHERVRPTVRTHRPESVLAVEATEEAAEADAKRDDRLSPPA